MYVDLLFWYKIMSIQYLIIKANRVEQDMHMAMLLQRICRRLSRLDSRTYITKKKYSGTSNEGLSDFPRSHNYVPCPILPNTSLSLHYII